MVKRTVKSQSVHDRFSLFGCNIRVLLLRLASFGATPRPLARLRGRRSIRLSSSGCILGHVCGGRRSTTVDSGMRTLIGVDFADGRVVVDKLLVHKSEGSASISTRAMVYTKKTN